VSARAVLVVQHEDQCPPAWFGTWLLEAGHVLDVRRPYAGDPLPGDLTGHAGLLVLGGSMGAYDDRDHPWLLEVKELAREAVASDVPALGICLGYQLLAVAMGGEVVRNPAGQQLGLLPLGWRDDVDDDPLFSRIGRPHRGVFWNDDIVRELPPGAVTLAGTPDGIVQAVRFAPSVWGVQLHPEVDDRILAAWAETDRSRHPEGAVDRALEAIRDAREELVDSWRPLAEEFGRQTRRPVRTGR
jgi:GMP synthase (glutamine-hydrolysing)